MDTQYVFGNGPGNPPTAVVLGPNYMASRFYHLSPPEVRPPFSLVRKNSARKSD